MDFDLLDVFFKVGRLAAVTPPSIKLPNEEFYQKFWALIIFTAYTILNFYFLISKHLSRHYNYLHQIIICLTDLSLYIFNGYVILVFTFWKRNEWSLFLKTLKVKKVIKLDQKKSQFWCNALLIFAQTLYWVLASYFFYLRFIQGDFKYALLRQVEHYIQFFYTCMLCYLLHVFSTRYEFLYSALLQNEKGVSKQHCLKKIGLAMFLQKKAIDVFNDLLGWPISLMICYAVGQCLDNIGDIIYMESNSIKAWTHSALTLITLSSNLFMMAMCSMVLDKRKKIVMYTYEMNWSFEREKQKVEESVDLIRKTEVRFTAAHFFALNKSTILNVLNTISSFVIVLAQFRE